MPLPEATAAKSHSLALGLERTSTAHKGPMAPSIERIVASGAPVNGQWISKRHQPLLAHAPKQLAPVDVNSALCQAE